MKYPKWVMDQVEYQKEHDDIGCMDPRAQFVMAIFGRIIIFAVTFGLGMLVANWIW